MHNLIEKIDHRIPYFKVNEKGKYLTRKSVTEEQILKAADSIVKSRLVRKGKKLRNTQEYKVFLSSHYNSRNFDNMVFIGIFMDLENRIISMEELFFGSIDSLNIYPRVILKRALNLNAASVLISHNHPSGHAVPNQTDTSKTILIKKALSSVAITLKDHIIIGEHNCYSLKEIGYLN